MEIIVTFIETILPNKSNVPMREQSAYNTVNISEDIENGEINVNKAIKKKG